MENGFKKGDLVKIILPGRNSVDGTDEITFGIGLIKKITNVFKGDFPYQIEDMYKNYGFYSNEALTPIKTSLTANIGDTVIVKGCGFYNSTASGEKTENFESKKMKIVAILKNAKCKYGLSTNLKAKNLDFKSIIGWFSEENISKNNNK